jgi:hypothetical protein
MANLREILVNWTTVAGGGFLNVLYFNDNDPIASQRQALGTMLTSMQTQLTTLTTWTVSTSGRVIDDATGTLVGDWNDGTARTGTGTASGGGTPDATLVLLRWRGTAVVNGRRIQGRTFVPGLAGSNIAAGNLAPAAQGILQNAATTYANTGLQHLLWHRPVNGAGGSSHGFGPGGVSVWPELAVLRRRRR